MAQQVTEQTSVVTTRTRSSGDLEPQQDLSYSGSLYSVRSATKSNQLQSSYNAMFRPGQRVGWKGVGYSSLWLSTSSANSSFEDVPALLSSRSEEKQKLGLLNNRFVNYIEKVHKLEARNRYLEAQVSKLEKNKVSFSRSGEIYESQLVAFRSEIESINHERAELAIQLHNCQQEIVRLQQKIIAVEVEKTEFENESTSLRRDVDMATLARVDLERKVETLQEELQLTKMTCEEDIKALQEQLMACSTNEQIISEYQSSDLSATLGEIREAYDKLVHARKVDVDVVYKDKIDGLVGKLDVSNREVNSAKNEAMDFKRQLHSVTVEMESLRTGNSALETQIMDLEKQYETEIGGYANKIKVLEMSVSELRDNLAKSMVDYNDLMNAKLSLSLEIETYRRLLEGEDGRLQIDTASVEVMGTQMTEQKTVRVITKETTRQVSGSSSSSSSSSSDSD